MMTGQKSLNSHQLIIEVILVERQKKYIVGEVLDYEALYIGEGRKNENYQIHRFLVEDKFIDHADI